MATHRYKHIEADVDVYQLSKDTQAEIADVLSKQAGYGLLAKLSIEFNKAVDCNEFVFRYKSSTKESNLTFGNYLVQMNDGTYVVKDAATFEQQYIHTDCDPEQGVVQTVAQAFVTLAIDNNVEGISELTVENATTLANSLENIYNADNDLLIVPLVSRGLNDPTGLATVIEGFAKSSKMGEETTLMIDLGNDSREINLFNLIGLQQLIAEFRKLDKATANKISRLSFTGTSGNISSVSTSVTENQWLDWIDDVRGVTGINSNRAVVRSND